MIANGTVIKTPLFKGLWTFAFRSVWRAIEKPSSCNDYWVVCVFIIPRIPRFQKIYLSILLLEISRRMLYNQDIKKDSGEDMAEFTHFDDKGNAAMVDVGEKAATKRQAVAFGKIRMNEECYSAVRGGGVKKGDVLGAARIAGIMAVKQTSSLIPLCHTLHIDKAAVDFEYIDDERSIAATCTVKTTGVTGVEMEALTGVSVALLTIYDMCKAVDKSMEIGSIYLLEKTGGKSGAYARAN